MQICLQPKYYYYNIINIILVCVYCIIYIKEIIYTHKLYTNFILYDRKCPQIIHNILGWNSLIKNKFGIVRRNHLSGILWNTIYWATLQYMCIFVNTVCLTDPIIVCININRALYELNSGYVFTHMEK